MAEHTLREEEYQNYMNLKNEFEDKLEKATITRKKDELWLTRVGWWLFGFASVFILTWVFL